jgi:hypothetical protein
MKSNKKMIFILLVAVGFIFIFKLFLSNNNEISDSLTKEQIETKQVVAETKPIKSKLPMPLPNQDETLWTSWLEKQTEAIGHLTNDPEETQKQLQQTAEAIPKERIDWLRNRAKNQKINTDQRLLAIEYLSLNTNIETLDALEDIAISPVDENLNPALKNEAVALKAAAIEGLASKEGFKDKAIVKLNDIANKTEDKFLLDRVHRSLWYLKGAADKPEEQDTKALKELLGTVKK